MVYSLLVSPGPLALAIARLFLCLFCGTTFAVEKTPDARHVTNGTEFCVNRRRRILVPEPHMTPPTRKATRGHTDELAKRPPPRARWPGALGS